MSDLRIYVACLASYNNGVLHGAWIDVDGKDEGDIQEEVAAMLRASPYPNVMVTCPACDGDGEIDGAPCHSAECNGSGEVRSAEEWAIHDHEGFGNLIGESTSFEDVAAIAEVLGSDNQDTRRGFKWLIQDRGFTVAEAARRADEVRTSDGTATEYAEEFAADVYSEAMEGPLAAYIDFDRFARDLVLGGDIDEVELDGESFIVTNAHEF